MRRYLGDFWLDAIHMDVVLLLCPACLPELSTLQLGHNIIGSMQDIAHLALCPSISVLDLSYNKLRDPGILGVLEAMPNLVRSD